jgi:hypothetical protein
MDADHTERSRREPVGAASGTSETGGAARSGGAGASALADAPRGSEEPAAEPAPLEPPDPALRAARRPATSLLTFGTVALVLVIVIVLVVIKVTGNSTVATSPSTVPPAPAPSAVVQAVTHIPGSVYDAVGVTSPTATVQPPTVLRGKPSLTTGGRPEVLFVGSEFCPYCAAERWALVAALSRFGRFTTLNAMQSGGNEAFSSTPTFTFYGSRYVSRYVSAVLLEQYGTQKNASGTGYAPLQHLNAKERTLMRRFDTATAGGTGRLVPFVDIANRGVVAGGSFSPSILQQLSATQVATALKDAKDPSTQAIVAAANYLSAVICAADGAQPTSVCTSTGVTAAALALGVAP